MSSHKKHHGSRNLSSPLCPGKGSADARPAIAPSPSPPLPVPRGGSSWLCKSVVMLLCPPSLDGCGSEQLLDSSCETGPGHSLVLPIILSQVSVSGLVWAGRVLVILWSYSALTPLDWALSFFFSKHITVVYEIKCIFLTTLRSLLGVLTQSSGVLQFPFLRQFN